MQFEFLAVVSVSDSYRKPPSLSMSRNFESLLGVRSFTIFEKSSMWTVNLVGRETIIFFKRSLGKAKPLAMPRAKDPSLSI